MDGIHDLGGKFGFGDVAPTDDPVGFPERWHGSVFTMMFNLGGQAYGSGDQVRHAIERIDPVAYLTHGYYGRWLGGLETLLLESGLLSTEEIESRVAELDPNPPSPAARPDPRPEVFASRFAGPDAKRILSTKPIFHLGQRVRTRGTPSTGHTRLPAYARAKCGTVVALQGGWVLPDASAHGDVGKGEHLYTVAFDGAELWGDSGEPGLSVRLDLFESYLSEEAE